MQGTKVILPGNYSYATRETVSTCRQLSSELSSSSSNCCTFFDERHTDAKWPFLWHLLHVCLNAGHSVLLVWCCLRPQYLHVGSEELSEFLFSFFFSFFEDLDPSLFFQRFVSPVFLSRSVLTSSVCLSPLVAVVPYFFDITRHYHFSCVGKKMSLSLLSGKYLNFLAPLARLNNGLPRVKSKSLITCVICSRVVSSLELFGVHLLRTWNKSERWCHSFNIRQGPSRLPFAVNQ